MKKEGEYPYYYIWPLSIMIILSVLEVVFVTGVVVVLMAKMIAMIVPIIWFVYLIILIQQSYGKHFHSYKQKTAISDSINLRIKQKPKYI